MARLTLKEGVRITATGAIETVSGLLAKATQLGLPGFGKDREIKEPGKRGGKFYRTEKSGKVRYGQKPAPREENIVTSFPGVSRGPRPDLGQHDLTQTEEHEAKRGRKGARGERKPHGLSRSMIHRRGVVEGALGKKLSDSEVERIYNEAVDLAHSEGVDGVIGMSNMTREQLDRLVERAAGGGGEKPSEKKKAQGLGPVTDSKAAYMVLDAKGRGVGTTNDLAVARRVFGQGVQVVHNTGPQAGEPVRDEKDQRSAMNEAASHPGKMSPDKFRELVSRGAYDDEGVPAEKPAAPKGRSKAIANKLMRTFDHHRDRVKREREASKKGKWTENPDGSADFEGEMLKLHRSPGRLNAQIHNNIYHFPSREVAQAYAKKEGITEPEINRVPHRGYIVQPKGGSPVGPKPGQKYHRSAESLKGQRESNRRTRDMNKRLAKRLREGG